MVMSERLGATIKYILLGLSAIVPILFLIDVVDLDVFIGLAYLFLGLAIALMVVFPIVSIIISPADAKKSLFGFICLLGFVVVAFLISSTESLPFLTPNADNVPTVLRFVDTSIITLYLLSVVAVGTVVYTEVRDIFR